MPRNARAKYQGDRHSLIIAIDFGTVNSSASYAYLEPGKVPEIHQVSFSDKGKHTNKVPTVLLYDRAGALRAAGAQADDPAVYDEDEDGDWQYLSWFKFHLHPREENEAKKAPLPALPRGKTIETVIGDFLRYMNTCIRDHIGTTRPDGHRVLQGTLNDTIYLLSHPNSWDGYQQAKLRTAAIIGNLVPDTEDGKSRLKFVSEVEASLHWCVDAGLVRHELKSGSRIAIVDAGGGVINASAYEAIGTTSLQFQETGPSESRLAGSIFVTTSFQEFATKLLNGSRFGGDDAMERLVKEFDRKTKTSFRSKSTVASAAFISPWENDTELNIRAGRLFLRRDEMLKFFEHSCQEVTSAVLHQLSGHGDTVVCVVGGLAASPYFIDDIKNRLKDAKVIIECPQGEGTLTVANGAIVYFLNHLVTARVAKYSYGVLRQAPFEFFSRSQSSKDGKPHPEGRFSIQLSKGTVVNETMATIIPVTVPVTSQLEDTVFEVHLVAYKGDRKYSGYMDDELDQFRTLCTFKRCIPLEDISAKTSFFKPHKKVEANLFVFFGKVELGCYIEWKNAQGNTKREPVTVTWEEPN